MNLQEAKYREITGEGVFTTWREAVRYAIKKKLWGQVVVVKEGKFYIIKDKK